MLTIIQFALASALIVAWLSLGTTAMLMWDMMHGSVFSKVNPLLAGLAFAAGVLLWPFALFLWGMEAAIVTIADGAARSRGLVVVRVPKDRAHDRSESLLIAGQRAPQLTRASVEATTRDCGHEWVVTLCRR